MNKWSWLEWNIGSSVSLSLLFSLALVKMIIPRWLKEKKSNVMGAIPSVYKNDRYFWVFFRFSLHVPLCAFAHSRLFEIFIFVYIWESHKQFLLLQGICILFLFCKDRVNLWEIFFFFTIRFLHDHSLFYCSITEKYAYDDIWNKLNSFFQRYIRSGLGFWEHDVTDH